MGELMIKTAEKYKEITLDLLKKLENNEFDDINDLIDKRQFLIDSQSDKKEFKKAINDIKILDIDNKIYHLLEHNIESIKREIKEQKISKQANNLYINVNKNKFNIFNKKV